MEGERPHLEFKASMTPHCCRTSQDWSFFPSRAVSCGEFAGKSERAGGKACELPASNPQGNLPEVRTKCLLAENRLYELPVLQAPHPGPPAKWLLSIALSTNIPGLTQENLQQNIEDSYNDAAGSVLIPIFVVRSIHSLSPGIVAPI